MLSTLSIRKVQDVGTHLGAGQTRAFAGPSLHRESSYAWAWILEGRWQESGAAVRSPS